MFCPCCRAPHSGQKSESAGIISAHAEHCMMSTRHAYVDGAHVQSLGAMIGGRINWVKFHPWAPKRPWHASTESRRGSFGGCA